MVVRLSALSTDRIYPQKIHPVLISVRGWIDPRAIVWSEGFMSMKNSMTPSGIETATFWFVAQYLSLKYRQTQNLQSSFQPGSVVPWQISISCTHKTEIENEKPGFPCKSQGPRKPEKKSNFYAKSQPDLKVKTAVHLTANFRRKWRWGKLTLILLTWRIWWDSNKAKKWQLGFISAFEGLNYFRREFERLVTAYC
jgi:hypothetical protein